MIYLKSFNESNSDLYWEISSDEFRNRKINTLPIRQYKNTIKEILIRYGLNDIPIDVLSMSGDEYIELIFKKLSLTITRVEDEYFLVVYHIGLLRSVKKYLADDLVGLEKCIYDLFIKKVIENKKIIQRW